MKSHVNIQVDYEVINAFAELYVVIPYVFKNTVEKGFYIIFIYEALNMCFEIVFKVSNYVCKSWCRRAQKVNGILPLCIQKYICLTDLIVRFGIRNLSST